MERDSLPVSTKWLLDAVGISGRLAIQSVFMIMCQKTQTKGTGFLTKQGYIITNWHVVEGNEVSDIQAISSSVDKIDFSDCVNDQDRDLAALTPVTRLENGLDIIVEKDVQVGTQVTTWGYPLGYNGPAPLLSVGYLSGFNDSPPYEETKSTVKHLSRPNNAPIILDVECVFEGNEGDFPLAIELFAPRSGELQRAFTGLGASGQQEDLVQSLRRNAA